MVQNDVLINCPAHFARDICFQHWSFLTHHQAQAWNWKIFHVSGSVIEALSCPKALPNNQCLGQNCHVIH